jgi:hypothetical protein
MENTIIYLAIITSALSILGTAFTAYLHFRNPDIKADKQLGINKVACEEKHHRIDEINKEIKENMKELNNTFALFRQNDFHHIEENTGKINERMARMEGQNETVIRVMTEVLNKK